MSLGDDLEIAYYRFTQDEADGADRKDLARQLSAVHHAESFPGEIAVRYLADPDPVSSWLRQSDIVHLMALCHPEEGVIGFGTCLERPGYLRGAVRRLGYFASLKLLPAWRTKVRRIASVYMRMYELTRANVDLWYTTILSENEAALKLLTKPRRSMPAYLHQGTYQVFCFAAARPLPDSFSLNRPAPPADSELFARLDLSLTGFSSPLLHDALIPQIEVRGGSRAYVKDLRDCKQYVLDSYGGRMRLVSKVPFQVAGYPRFPKEGTHVEWTAGQIIPGEKEFLEADVQRLLQAMRRESGRMGAELLLVGAMKNSPLAQVLGRHKHVSYTSELFLVDWEKQGLPALQDISLDVAFL